MSRTSPTSVPLQINEAKYSHKTQALVPDNSYDQAVATRSGEFLREFRKPGMYYFQTDGVTRGVMHTCMVHVRERQRCVAK